MNIGSITPNRYFRFHNLSLTPLLSDNPLEALTWVKNSLQEAEQKTFLVFILNNGLGPLWQNLLQKHNIQSFISPEFTRELRNITSHTATLFLFQKSALEKIDTIFTTNDIPYAVFKGVHTRECLYPEPAIRYSCDIDILISKTSKVKAIQKLIKAGFSFHPVAKNISTEATLTDGRAVIDLHWDIMRPGRTRKEMADIFIESRKKFTGYWALNNEATLFIMLVHPVFTEYSTSPHASLIKLVDLYCWLQSQEIDWENVLDYLEQGGVKTAAWITAEWLKMMTGEPLPELFMQRIKPAPLKARYLRMWLKRNLSTRLLAHPVLVQTGFTLPAHDTLADALRFTWQIIRTRKEAARKTEELINSLNQ